LTAGTRKVSSEERHVILRERAVGAQRRTYW
jgi:hypothetical protein